MAQVQRQFEQFNEAIKLKRFDENATLREKRDIIREKLRKRLPGVFEKYGEECPEFSFRDQGSYEMGTGTKPIDGDYDIDQGLYFEVATADYPDPVVLKERVFEALNGHTDDVRIRRPCVTVTYQREGEALYHVDFAIYSAESDNADGKSRLAKGRKHSTTEHRIWEVSNPRGLTDTIEARFSGLDRKQFRRTIRYLKRWRDRNFVKDGGAAPLGIGLTVAAYENLVPTYFDVVSGKADDLDALRKLVCVILNRFTFVWDTDAGRMVHRLTVTLPVEPGNDLFARMTAKQMADFEVKLTTLQTALDTAQTEVDPVVACETLRGVFGDDFPVPPKAATGKQLAPAIASSSSSA